MFIFFCFLILYFLNGAIKYVNMDEEASRIKYLSNFESNVSELVLSQSDESDSLVVRKIRDMIMDNGPMISMAAPIEGFVTQAIDSLKNHNGIDIVSKKGDIIKAADSGVVVFSGFSGNLGNTLIVSHPYDYFTLYGHCDTIFVEERQLINKGEGIALLGDSGETTAPHLHFEIWKNDKAIDPRKIISKYGDLDVSKEW